MCALVRNDTGKRIGVESGKWKAESGKWKAESGKWKVKGDGFFADGQNDTGVSILRYYRERAVDFGFCTK